MRVSPEQLGAPATLLPSKAGSTVAASREVMAAARPGVAAVTFPTFSIERIAKVAAGAALATLTLEFSLAFAVTHFLRGQSKYLTHIAVLQACLEINVLIIIKLNVPHRNYQPRVCCNRKVCIQFLPGFGKRNIPGRAHTGSPEILNFI